MFWGCLWSSEALSKGRKHREALHVLSAPGGVSICSPVLMKTCCMMLFRKLQSSRPFALIFNMLFVCLSSRNSKTENKLFSKDGAHYLSSTLGCGTNPPASAAEETGSKFLVKIFPKRQVKRVSTISDSILYFLILHLFELSDLSKKTHEESSQWRPSKAARKCTPDKQSHNHFKCKLPSQTKCPNSVYYPSRSRSTESKVFPLYMPDLRGTLGWRFTSITSPDLA